MQDGKSEQKFFQTAGSKRQKVYQRSHENQCFCLCLVLNSESVVALFWRQSDAYPHNNAISTYIELQIAWAIFVYKTWNYNLCFFATPPFDSICLCKETLRNRGAFSVLMHFNIIIITLNIINTIIITTTIIITITLCNLDGWRLPTHALQLQKCLSSSAHNAMESALGSQKNSVFCSLS